MWIAAPNMLHVELVEAAAQAGKHVFCEKPVGGTPEQTARAERAVRRAGVIGGVGFNYRWAPLVRYAAELIAAGELGTLTNYRGRFFSMYGADPLGVLSWRFRLDEGGYGVDVRPAVPRRRPRALPGRADHARRRHDRDVHPRAAARRRARTTAAAGAEDPHARRHQRGLRRDAVRVRERRARLVRGEPRDRRAGEPDGVRRARHRRRGGLGPRGAQRAAALPGDRRTAARATRPCSAASASRRTARSSRAARTGSGTRTW